jgi:hypothetical protein
MSRHRAPSRRRNKAQQLALSLGCCARFYVRIWARATAHPEYWRVIRGAFLAPWFAVGLGIVVAASLSLTTPLTALSFPPAKGHCVSTGCGGAPRRPAKNTASGPTAAVNRQATAPEQKDQGDRSGRSVEVRYRLLTRHQGRFMAMIEISGRRPLGNWRLRFLLPGARVTSVMWGPWTTDDSGAITVSGGPSPWPRSSPDQARIVISGAGAPQWPWRCVFNRVRCVVGRLDR